MCIYLNSVNFVKFELGSVSCQHVLGRGGSPSQNTDTADVSRILLREGLGELKNRACMSVKYLKLSINNFEFLRESCPVFLEYSSNAPEYIPDDNRNHIFISHNS